MIYLIGSLRNPEIQNLAEDLRADGHVVFDDWYAPGARTDEHWRDYEVFRGRSFTEALDGKHAWNVFEYDKRNLDAADIAVLVLPAGKSGHLELGYCVGTGKRTAVLLDKEPERFDVMYRFADTVCNNQTELRVWLKQFGDQPNPLLQAPYRADTVHRGEPARLFAWQYHQVPDEVRRQEWLRGLAQSQALSGNADPQD